MHGKTFLVSIFLLIGIISCTRSIKTKQPQYLPKDLNSAINHLNKTFSSTEKSSFKNKPENKAVSNLYLSVGLWIRNNWIYGQRDTDLVRYFNSVGIFHPDDISSIILTSLHRKLNNKPINLQMQVDEYKAYWKSVNNCEEKTRKQTVEKYNQFKIGSPITVLMYVDTSNKKRNAITFTCPTIDWKFNSKKDLEIGGVVTDKYTINSASNVFFKVRIKKMNFPNTEILMDTVKTGDIKDFSLDNLTVK